MSVAAGSQGARARLLDRLRGPSAVLIGTTAALNLLRIGNTMLLTRLLAPRDFGLVGMVMSTLYVVSLVTDTGYQGFVVRDARGDEPRFLDTIWTLHVIRALLVGLVLAAVAWPLSMLVAKPDLAPLVVASGGVMVIEGLVSTAPFTAVRHGRIRLLSTIDLVGTLVQMATGLAAGALLHNAWAVLLSMLVAAMVRTGLSYLVFPNARRRVAFDRGLAGELWRFSRVIAASSAITLVISQIDKLILARVLSLSEFGVYAIAANLATAPVMLAGMYISRIAYPAAAARWRDATEGRAAADGGAAAIYAGRGAVYLGYLLACGVLIGAAPLVVRLIYDPRYAGAARYLGILAVASAMFMITKTISESLVAIGVTRATLAMNFARLAWLAGLGTLLFVVVGPFGLVVALGLVELPAYAYALGLLARRGLLDPGRELAGLAALGAGIALGTALAAAAQHIRPA